MTRDVSRLFGGDFGLQRVHFQPMPDILNFWDSQQGLLQLRPHRACAFACVLTSDQPQLKEKSHC